MAGVNEVSIPRGASDLDAVIFVHGISPHQPMVALEALIEQYETRLPPLAPEDFSWALRYHHTADDVQPTPFYAVTAGAHNERHFFEALWSPLAKHRVPVWRVAAWLLAASLRPDRFRSRHSPQRKQNADAITLIALGTAIAFVGSIVAWALGLSIATAGLAWAAPISLEQVGSALCVFLAVWYGLANRNVFSYGSLKKATLRRPLVIAIVGLSAIIVSAIWALVTDVLKHGWQVVVALSIALLVLAALTFFAHALRRGLAGSIADIYIATRTDINDPAFRVREAITDQVAELIHSVLVAKRRANPTQFRYRKIVVLGHSLGSVIALDAIRRLYERYLADDGAEDDFSQEDARSDEERFPLSRLSALITYGSPLQKVGVFRGMHASAPTAYEGFLRRETTAIFDVAKLGSAAWSNYWFLEDPICDPLRTVEWLVQPSTIVDVEMEGGRYFSAHGDYAKQPEFWTNCLGAGVLDLLR